MNKYAYLVVLQGDYGFGHGWEDLSAFEGSKKWSEARQCRREYRDNEGGTYRLIERRERLGGAA